MAYDAKAVANYFLDCAERSGQTLDPLKLQKLVYFAHGWCLALTGQPLIEDRVEAWAYGPVIRRLYGEFKRFGDGAITERATEVTARPGATGLHVVRFTPTIDACSQDADQAREVRALLDRVWAVYGKFSGVQLSNMTHVADGPWQQTRSRNRGVRDPVIDDGEIRKYFRGALVQPAQEPESEAVAPA